MSDPAITVIAAGVNVGRTLAPWLDAMAGQVGSSRAEVLLALTSVDAFVAEQLRSSPWAEVVDAAHARSVPELWGAALSRARGRIVAITTTACRPSPDWIDAVARAHAKPHAAIGGVIDLAAQATLVDRAIHFVRYAPYLPPVAEGPAAEIAADNGAYKLAALVPLLPGLAREGFWEVEVHRALRANGHTIWLDPNMRVYHAAAYSIAGFSRQRFVHGRRFARAARPRRSAGHRLLLVARAPLVPALMLGRIVRTLARRRRLDRHSVLALPLSAWFLVCWAAGEATGHIDG